MRRQQDESDQNERPVDDSQERIVPTQAFGHELPRPGVHASIVKVSAHSRPNAVAGAIAGECRRFGTVEVQAIGASALNQAVKAIVLARAFLRDEGIDICCIPSFTSVMFADQQRTGVQLRVVQHEMKGPEDAAP
jgi:stage V sporulation protein S